MAPRQGVEEPVPLLQESDSFQVPVLTFLHFRDREAEGQWLKHLPKVTQPARIKVLKAQALPHPPSHRSRGSQPSP